MNYFKADICLMTERYINNDISKGLDYRTFNYNGVIDSITAQSLLELKEKLNKIYDLNAFVVSFDVDDSKHLTSSDDMCDSEGIIYEETVNIYIYEIEENPISIERLLNA